MNSPKCGDRDYINFMIAAQREPSVAPKPLAVSPHTRQGGISRCVHSSAPRQPPDTEALRRETQEMVDLDGGLLALDDSTLHKPYAKRIELVTRH